MEHSKCLNRRVGGQSGFGLIEVMVVAAVISIIALGISTLFTDMFGMQAKLNQQGTFANVRQRMVQTINNTESWARTVADATNVEMACLRNSTACTSKVGLVDQWYPLTLRNADNVIVFSEQFAGAGGETHGFDTGGALCLLFNPAAPNSACALSYDLQWHATCAGGALTCTAPGVEVRGTALFATNDAGGGAINTARYSFLVTRGSAAIRNDPVVIVNRQDESGGLTGEGNCKLAWVRRKFNTVDVDPAGNAAVVGGDSFTLVPGTYNCRISAPAFKAGGVRINLVQTAGTVVNITSPTVIAPLTGGSATAIIDTTLKLNLPTTLILNQFCTNNPADTTTGSTNANFSMGLPVPDAGSYSAITYTVVSCLRTS